ncbi:MAG: UDP-3-O-[3-hydroxymyristoyl] N-acetylglucosamine deacetylase [Deltaproteobacteria bacterium CG2_30_66_27]|nr:MAG: UDP-3-O-[3-hydroxymyristoyl] N-acetylglucosamine deacetylase [Deltaproteobacteria bacterium CG2_30_66_27]PJB31600.1 MAG: UDP-3-O-[3-hydroxymyristoyl] N-acetylglucosamine deacetylase [Deltaproteobacteria bacterium CG_4_9_14_3_um_filter_65_9]
MPNPGPILIVDDEASIRKSLEGVLGDEGFSCALAVDGADALSKLQSLHPSLVLLDIWMPGMDGIETLRRMKAEQPSMPVIMMSGHATISTAIKATKIGASDFIEKPLELDILLNAIHRALGTRDAVRSPAAGELAGTIDLRSAEGVPKLQPLVFGNQTLRGALMPQRTLARSAVLYGQGLHSGRKSGLIFEPLGRDSGIHFVGVSDHRAVPAHVDFVESTGYATTIRLGTTHVATIEHVLSALNAYGVSNLLIKCNGEVPVLDGSAVEFCSLFEEVGFENQIGNWHGILLKEPVRIDAGKASIRLEPCDAFEIDYTLEYPAPVGRQRFVFRLDDPATYRKEIAPARTFGFARDIGLLQRQGLALGGRFDNFVLFGEEGPINGALRFPDEPVRHKIMDMIGDLYLLGRRLQARVTAHMTGHTQNIAVLKKMRELL